MESLFYKFYAKLLADDAMVQAVTPCAYVTNLPRPIPKHVMSAAFHYILSASQHHREN